MSSLRWGILGTAQIGKRVMKGIGLSKACCMQAVASRDKTRALEWAKEHGIPRAFGSYEELLSSGEVDAIYNPLPNSMHAEWTIKALEAGLPVLCEKPFTLNAAEVDVAQEAQKLLGGVHGVLVTAVSNAAFSQAVGMLRRGGFMSLVGLPPGDFPLPIFEIVLKRITVRGSIVGTRNDLRESLEFAGAGKVASHFSWDRLENINAIFDRMKAGQIDGRVVLEI